MTVLKKDYAILIVNQLNHSCSAHKIIWVASSILSRNKSVIGVQVKVTIKLSNIQKLVLINLIEVK
jgi:hypothetical protein